MWKWSLSMAALVALAGCSRGPDEPSAAASAIPTQAELDRWMAGGMEPVARRLAVGDYFLHYHLMRETGVTEALGGEEQAIAALKAVGEAHERNLRWGEREAPRMIPASFTGEGMEAGMYGFGGAALVGAMANQLMQETDFDTHVRSEVERVSDPAAQMPEVGTSLLESGEVTASGNGEFRTEKTDVYRDREGKETGSQTTTAEIDKDGASVTTEEKSNGATTNKATISIDKDGSLTIESNVKEKGIEGKIKVKVRMDKCPDPDGKVTLVMVVDSQMGVVGKPGTGGTVHAEFEYERWLDDDAHLIKSDEKITSNMRLQVGGSEGGHKTSFDVSMGLKDGEGSFTEHKTEGLSIFRPAETKYANDAIAGIYSFLNIMAGMMVDGIGKGAPWESGRCVKLELTTDPQKRTGQRPNTAYDIEAKPRATLDGLPTGGTVRAILSGDSSLVPSGTKVDADATFGYANPSERDKEASIDFEARSKRGVGRATANFDTRKKGYVIGGCRLSGRVPDVDGPFNATVGGYDFRFSPTGDKAGTWNWSASGARGEGPYHITLDEDGSTGTLTLPPGKTIAGGHTMATEAWTCTLTASDE